MLCWRPFMAFGYLCDKVRLSLMSFKRQRVATSKVRSLSRFLLVNSRFVVHGLHVVQPCGYLLLSFVRMPNLLHTALQGGYIAGGGTPPAVPMDVWSLIASSWSVPVTAPVFLLVNLINIL